MREFDWGRWGRMLATAIAATWVLVLLGAVIDSIDPPEMFSTGLRVRLYHLWLLGTVNYAWSLTVGLLLVLAWPSRGLLNAYVVVAIAMVVLGLLGFVNVLLPEASPYTSPSRGFQAASHLAGAVIGVVMFAVARDRLATYPASSPEENR